MIQSHTHAPAQIFAGQDCPVWFSSNRHGRGYLSVYAGSQDPIPLIQKLSSPIAGGICQFDIGGFIEPHATGLSIPLSNIAGLYSSLPSIIAGSTVSAVRILASDIANTDERYATELFRVPLMRGEQQLPAGQMFMYRGVPEMLRGSWAIGHAAPMGIECTLRVRAIRADGYTDIVGAGQHHIPYNTYSDFAVNLQYDPRWRDATSLEISAVLLSGEVYKSAVIQLREKRYGDAQAYFRNTYGAFQPAILRSVSEDVSVKYSATEYAVRDTRAYCTGGSLRAVPADKTIKHQLSASAGYYEHGTGNTVAEFMRSTELYINDSNYLRRMVHASKNSTPVRSMQDAVLSADCTLIDYNHNNIITRRKYYDPY